MLPYIVAIGVTFAVAGITVLWMMRKPGKDGEKRKRTGSAESATRSRNDSADSTSAPPAATEKKEKGPKQPSLKALQKNAKSMTKTALAPDTKATAHPCYVANIRGCNNEVTAVAWSAQGDKVVVSCVDYTVRVYTTESIEAGKGTLASLKTTGDHVTACDFTHDGNGILCAMDGSRKLRRYDIKGSVLDQKSESASALHKYPVKWLHSSKGIWVATLSEEDDTSVKFWDYSGKLLKEIDTKQVKCYSLVAALNGKFLGCAAWAPGIKVMEVKEFKDKRAGGVGMWGGAEHAMSLKSEKGLTAVAFSGDHTRAVTAQKDGKLCVWRTDVRYEVNEDPKKVIEKDFPDVHWQCLGIVADTLMACANGGIQFFDLETLEPKGTPVEAAHRNAVSMLLPHPEKRLFLSYARDATPRCWKLP